MTRHQLVTVNNLLLLLLLIMSLLVLPVWPNRCTVLLGRVLALLGLYRCTKMLLLLRLILIWVLMLLLPLLLTL
jgi:hypothetical protein